MFFIVFASISLVVMFYFIKSLTMVYFCSLFLSLLPFTCTIISFFLRGMCVLYKISLFNLISVKWFSLSRSPPLFFKVLIILYCFGGLSSITSAVFRPICYKMNPSLFQPSRSIEIPCWGTENQGSILSFALSLSLIVWWFIERHRYFCHLFTVVVFVMYL